ncbi:hypothetical protein G6F66_008788 [Rhizopus arrhizus]|nr:hypothetical protein G6F66_008788 [Rhizopus arrhizus]
MFKSLINYQASHFQFIPNFNRLQATLMSQEDYMTVLEVLMCVDQNIITLKQATLRLLTLAADMDPFKANMIEGIADL